MWDGGGWWPVRTKVQHKGLRGAHWHNILSMETYQVFVLESISRTMSKHLWQLNKICLPNGLQQTWFKQESFLFVTTFINSCLWVIQAKGACFHQQHLSNRIKWGLKICHWIPSSWFVQLFLSGGVYGDMGTSGGICVLQQMRVRLKGRVTKRY